MFFTKMGRGEAGLAGANTDSWISSAVTVLTMRDDRTIAPLLPPHTRRWHRHPAAGSEPSHALAEYFGSAKAGLGSGLSIVRTDRVGLHIFFQFILRSHFRIFITIDAL